LGAWEVFLPLSSSAQESICYKNRSTDPLQAQAVGLIAGAFIIALATILIYFIFTPRKRFQSEKAHRSHAQTPVHSLVMTPSPLVPPKETAKNLASTIASA